MEIISVLGWICSFSSIAVQFVGIEICYRIWKKGSTGDISPAPFVANLIAAGLWVKYGLLTSIQSLIIVNTLGALLALIYVIFFYIYSIRKNHRADCNRTNVQNCSSHCHTKGKGRNNFLIKYRYHTPFIKEVFIILKKNHFHKNFKNSMFTLLQFLKCNACNILKDPSN